MKSAKAFISSRLTERQLAGNYRALKVNASMVDFCSNDYLGFARSPVLKTMIGEETDRHQQSTCGATGSRLLTGNTAYALQLEQDIAAIHQAEAALVFNSGYDANVGLLSSLPQRGDTVILDELSHASLIDGARLSHANRYTFRHNDADSLEDKLKHAKGVCYVVIESVYSMDGDMAPIAALLALCESYGANLIVDEAHALGVFGLGLVNRHNLQNRVLATVVTFGKAMGCHGAAVLGSEALIAYLVNFARSFIYTTAAPFHQLAAIKMAYRLLQQSQPEQQALLQHISYFSKQMIDSGFQVLPSDSAIQCLMVHSNQKAKMIADELTAAGLDVRPILSPTVPSGTERLRICLHAFNTRLEMDKLITTIKNLNG